MAKQGALKKENLRKGRAETTEEAQQPLRNVRGSTGSSGANAHMRGPESAAELDRLIHERMRLAIVSALAVNTSLTFNDLKELLNTTDGNLSVHARKLEEAQYVTCNKYFDGRTPKTEYRLTAAGRRALERYLNHMETLIRATRAR
ncbi:MAG TPA: transcriptional regulator [Pyrinomonadaceae bacterium]|nr:transcriptional regulator [Pyrinomonadaceae bacterium]